MHWTLKNLTQEGVVCRPLGNDFHFQGLTLGANARTSIDLPKGVQVALSPLELHHYESKEWSIKPEGISLHVSLALTSRWRAVSVPDECPWRIYLRRVTHIHQELIILPRRNLSSFLPEMPDRLPLSSLCLPGTHDTMAFYGWPISQCQTLSNPLAVQLQSGIRVIDIRLAVVNSRLLAYHGAYPQRTSFQEILSTIHAFLTASSSSGETIVMSIKQEDFKKTPVYEFSSLVNKEILNGPGGRDMWFFQNRIPTLGEVRGKVILFSRFGGNGDGWENGLEGLGIHPSTWPDSEKFGFTWQCKDTLVRTHDWYNIPSFLAIPEKLSLATQILMVPPNSPPMPVLSISFLSAASFPLALPPVIAAGLGWPTVGLGIEGVNSRFATWLLDLLSEDTSNSASVSEKKSDGPRIRGWTFLDFYSEPDPGLVPLLVECNYRGRQHEEVGDLYTPLTQGQ
ncbi:PLC-like phosphodiesterase [Tricholoma matsutake]|nr:PLC-like phosphodiesterase [Tricholoma matsutake 945]